MKEQSSMKEGSTFHNESLGDILVVSYINSKKVIIRFLKTGYETSAEASNIRSGVVKDPLNPSVMGVGFIGVGDYKSRVDGVISPYYATWAAMLQRCYSASLHEAHPTYKDCIVCDEWHNFQAFAGWMEGQDHQGKQLDKDIKIEGNKVYSPDACMFVSARDNVIAANAKCFSLMSPCGEVVKAFNMREFCRDNNLDQGAISRVCKGRRVSHKGWRLANLTVN